MSRVVEGYGVLPVGAEGSLFQRIFSSTSGIDPYSSAVSDVYQGDRARSERRCKGAMRTAAQIRTVGQQTSPCVGRHMGAGVRIAGKVLLGVDAGETAAP
jgi:hypothetical protein